MRSGLYLFEEPNARKKGAWRKELTKRTSGCFSRQNGRFSSGCFGSPNERAIGEDGRCELWLPNGKKVLLCSLASWRVTWAALIAFQSWPFNET